MKQEEVLRLLAGTAVLAGTALGYYVSQWFYLFVAFVGANLLQSAFSRWCPMMWVLDKLGVARESCCGKQAGKRALPDTGQ